MFDTKTKDSSPATPTSEVEKQGEKHEDEHIEHAHDHDEKLPDTEGQTWRDIDDGFDVANLKRTMRKVDRRIIPVLAAMYAISLIDRTNLALARAANNGAMNADLGLHIGSRYSIITLVFFPPYIIFEIPSQIGLRKVGPRLWLGCAVITWGVIMLGMAFVKSWTAMTGMRILLGIPEAALMPGAAYLISCWYPRRSMATRTTIFFMTSIILGGLANPVMYVISLLHGRGGYHGWSWIFILCGIITVVIGMAGLVLLPDFPDRAPFLTEEERHMVLTRIERDRADSEPDSMTMQKFWLYIRDPKIWLFGFFLGSATLGGYSHAYFQPRLLATIGFNNVESQLLTTPPPFWALLQSMVVATLADRYGWRAGAVAFNSVTLIVGTAMYSQLPLSMKAARYAGLFLSYGGAQSNVPLVISWSQTAIRAQSKRGFTSAVIIAWGGIGGILAGAAFIEKEAPKQFPTGVFLTMGMNAAVVVLAIGLHFWMRHQNRRADRGEIIIEGSEDFRYQ